MCGRFRRAFSGGVTAFQGSLTDSRSAAWSGAPKAESSDTSRITVLGVDAAKLLNDLCVRLGYSLPPDDQQRIIADPPTSVDDFTDAVVVAEGLDPVLMATEQRQQVRRMVAAAFGEPVRRSGRTERHR